jgi:hypothetical protein
MPVGFACEDPYEGFASSRMTAPAWVGFRGRWFSFVGISRGPERVTGLALLTLR